MSEDDEVEAYVDHLILSGAVEPHSIDEDGNFIYKMTEKMKDVDPDFYNHSVEQFYHEIMELWSLGFLEVDATEEDPVVRITEQALDEDAISLLSKENRTALEEVKRILRKK